MSEQAFQPLLYAISADVVKRLVASGMSLGAALGAFYSSSIKEVRDGIIDLILPDKISALQAPALETQN